MNKIEKILRSMSKKEREAMMLLMLQIKKDHTKLPGVTKLIGKKGLFRVRMGKYRIIFRIFGKFSEVIRITKRNEKTYSGL